MPNVASSWHLYSGTASTPMHCAKALALEVQVSSMLCCTLGSARLDVMTELCRCGREGMPSFDRQGCQMQPLGCGHRGSLLLQQVDRPATLARARVKPTDSGVAMLWSMPVATFSLTAVCVRTDAVVKKHLVSGRTATNAILPKRHGKDIS